MSIFSEVTPACMEMSFERFISSRERNEPPDIDVEHERHEEVTQYL